MVAKFRYEDIIEGGSLHNGEVGVNMINFIIDVYFYLFEGGAHPMPEEGLNATNH